MYNDFHILSYLSCYHVNSTHFFDPEITFDFRYVLVVHPGHYSHLYGTTGTTLQLGCTWLICGVLSITPLLGWWGHYSYQPLSYSCTFHNSREPSYRSVAFPFLLCPILRNFYHAMSVFTKQRRPPRNGLRWVTGGLRYSHLRRPQKHQYYWMKVACVKTEVACVAVLNAGHFGLCSKNLFVNTAKTDV